MSLYDDITVDAGGPQAEGWSKNFKMLQTQLQVKKVTLTQAKQSQRVRQGSTLAPVVDLKKQVVSEERPLFADPILSLIVGPKDAAILGEALCFVADEYDPLYPNDYEKVVKRQREERQRQREIERQKDMDDREKKRKERPEGGGLVQGPDSDDDEEDDEYEAEKRKRVLGGATIAPPSSLMDRDKSALPVEEDSMRHSRMGGKAAIPPPIFDEGSERSRSPPILPGTFLSNMGGTVAHKIMAKYGFREGQGLGKHEQGLSTALSVEKTSKRGGKIVIGEMQEKEASTSIPLASVAKKGTDQSLNPLTKMLKNPTKVVLLRNMVGAGEVDEDLEGETKEECEKYGKVIRCLIFELPTSNDEEAVRIFLEFERIESAIKAVVDLNGRYFGGRVVKASFYNLDKFRRLDLGENISP